MRAQYRSAGGDRIVEIDPVTGTTGCVADLVAALGVADPESGLVVDGMWLDPSTPLAAVLIREGSLIEPASHPRPAPPPSARVLTVTGGLRAGVRHRLGSASEMTVGRALTNDVVIDDPSVSRHHLVLRPGSSPTVVDLGSRNGTAIAEQPVRGPTPLPEATTLRMGATRLHWRVEPDDVPFAIRAGLGLEGGTSSFNRPPRAAPDVDPAVVTVPSGPAEAPTFEPLSWAGIVLPLIAGGLVAWLLSPMFAVFAALGPVLTIGTWLERRRRARRAERRERDHLERKLKRVEAGLAAIREAEVSRMAGLHPDLGEVVRRATAPSVRCWERRPADPDFMQLALGTADQVWTPELRVDGDGEAAARARELVGEQPPLTDVPSVVDLGAGRIVGLVGPPESTGAIARSVLLQAAVHHGPADLAIGVVADGHSAVDRWAWTRWLPHCADVVAGQSGGLVALGPVAADELVDSMSLDATPRTRLLVIDGAWGLAGRTAPGRMLLADERVAGLVMVDDDHHLPARCTTVVDVMHRAGRVRVLDPHTADATEGVVAWGVSTAVANEAARGLARLDDPELLCPASELPVSVSLVDLFEGAVDSEAVARRWAEIRGSADLRVPIGADGHGPLWLDLVADGPHVLVGGTTGSGKSELLRTLVAGLALVADPDHVAFVLIDYKGGAAFDVCAELPHVAGLVTDLDERLAERALRCLEAELGHRESRLREVGAEDLTAYRGLTAGRSVDPLPRLVVVIDEFASLAVDLPDFLRSLVGIAQRGRSLGVHLVLATQRPAGTVTEDMRANTGCRIALRVTDGRDSVDVIDAPDAASIPRQRPGQAVARFGPGELIGFQSALVSGRTRERGAVRVCDLYDPAGTPEPTDDTGDSDLDRLVRAAGEANRRRGGCRPRSPWPPPLPDDITLAELAASAENDPSPVPEPAAWLVDDPDGQTRTVEGWDPADGHLVVVGAPGSGTSTTLATVALDLARRCSADDLHLHVIDLDHGSLAPLAGLPHAGSVIEPSDADRRVRLIRWLDEEVAARRAGPGSECPGIVLVVDDLAGLSREHDPIREPEVHDRVSRIWADGPGVGIRLVVSVGRAGDLGPARLAKHGVVVVHRLFDPGEGLQFGCRADTSGFPAGRAVRAGDGRELQVARPGDLERAVEDAARDRPLPTVAPLTVGSLDAVIPEGELPVRADTGPGWVDLLVARDDDRLEPCGFTLHPGEHALVLGPPRSGRTNTLALMGRMLGDGAVVVGGPDSELTRRLDVPAVAPADLESVLAADPLILLVDDADRLDDPTGFLSSVIDRSTGPSIIAAVSPDRLRGRFGHWSAELRSCRSGLIFRPGPLDGDLLGVTLPPRLELPPLPGRGLIVSDGGFRVGQVALACA